MAQSTSSEWGPPRVSVVLISKNESSLASSLESLKSQVEELRAECIVVDASAGKLSHVACRFPWVRWLDFTAPAGTAVTIPHQRNAGVRASASTVIAFCDSGGIPSIRWLETLTKPLLEGRESVTCGPIRSTSGSIYGLINDLPDGATVQSLLTGNLAFRREAFDAIDGFDERFEYGSDADFGWRLEDAGISAVSVNAAVMTMDWGPWSLQCRRSWRYGKAKARLFAYHKGRRAWILRAVPYLVVYPAVWLMAALALLAAPIGHFLPLLAVSCCLAFLLLRNRKSQNPAGVLADHTVYSFAFLVELARLSLTKRLGPVAPVLFTPEDPGPYQIELMNALKEAGTEAGFVSHWTRSKTVNLLLLPANLLLLRIRGGRILHIHWVHDFDLKWTKALPAGRRLCRLWLSVILETCKHSRMPVVWTAHNILPHRQIFDDDVTARQRLVSRASIVIVHDAFAASQVVERFGAVDVHVIPQGATIPRERDRTAVRERLGLEADDRYLLFPGRLEHYKGTCQALAALTDLLGRSSHENIRHLVIGVVGAAADEPLRWETLTRLNALRGFGARTFRIDGYVPDAIYWDHVTSADLALFPFMSVTNSGSLIGALSCGTPALTMDLPSLRDFPSPAVRLCPKGDFDTFARTAVIWAKQIGQAERDAARAWALSHTWHDAAKRTASAYRQAIRRLS